MQIYPITWLILVGVVGAIIVFGVITNLIGAAVGPWSGLANTFPPRDRLPDANRGEVAFTLTRKPLHEYAGTGRRLRPFMVVLSWVFWLGLALWLVLAFTGMLGPSMSRGLGAVLWISTFGFYSLFMVWWGWRIIAAPAWPQQVAWVADDDHLHLRRVSDVIAKYPWISVPWHAIGEFTPTGPGVSFPIGDRFAFTAHEVVARELRVRDAMNADSPGHASAAPRSWSPDDAILGEGAVEADPVAPPPPDRRWP